MPRSASYRHALLLVAATACWGGGTVLSKQVLDRGVAPLTLLAIELAASASLLIVGAIAFRVRPTPSPTLAKLALLGVLNPGVAYALGLLGLATISASLSVLLWATEPVLIMLLAVAVLRERVAAATMVAVAVALIGVLLVLYRPGASGDAIGIGLTVGAVAACAFYTVLTRRLLLDDSSLEVVLVQQVAALGFAVTAAATASALNISDLGTPADRETWVLAAASGIVYYGLAFWLFIGGLRGVPASIAGSFFPLIPVFGLAAGYLVGDRLSDRQWLGAAIVVVATASATIYHLTRSTDDRQAETPACTTPDSRQLRALRAALADVSLRPCEHAFVAESGLEAVSRNRQDPLTNAVTVRLGRLLSSILGVSLVSCPVRSTIYTFGAPGRAVKRLFTRGRKSA